MLGDYPHESADDTEDSTGLAPTSPIILITASPVLTRGSSSKAMLTSNLSSEDLMHNDAPRPGTPASPGTPSSSSSSSLTISPPSSPTPTALLPSSPRPSLPSSPSTGEMMRSRSLSKSSSPKQQEERPSLQKKLSRFALKPFVKREKEQLIKSSSLPDFGAPARNKKDCSITVKVFEARNLPEARQRRKQAERNNKAIHRAQKMLLEVSSPNLMSFSDATDPYCLVQVDKSKMRTRTIEKKLNPFWCEEFTFEVLDASVSKVVLTVVDDKKYAQQGEVIGRLVLPINSFRDQREREKWFPIQQPTSTNKIPQVHMYIAYEQGNAEKKPVFKFQILGGRNLGLGTPGAVVPFVSFSWKLKDGAKDETWAWTEIHALATERELPAQLEAFHITLWRWKLPTEDEIDADGTRSEKVLLGQVGIPLVDMTEPRDYWFCLFGKETGLGDLRVKVKYTEEVVLTLEEYQEFLELLLDPNLVVVRTLAALAKPNTRESIAANLVRVFEKADKAVLLLDSLNSDEIDSTPNPDIIFRGNSLATKSVDMYMKLVGMPYLAYVLKNLIRKFYTSSGSKACEVDPSKLDKGEDLKQNWKNLIGWVQLFTSAIFESVHMCPKTLRQVFHGIQQKCMASFPGNVARFTAVSGFIFLRFFCPAILAPKLFDLHPDHPDIKQTRYLILVAKTLQNLANLVEFGLVKEEFMKNMNEFVLANMENMQNFITNIATVPETAVHGAPPEINIEKELASMYRHVMRHRAEMIAYHNSKGTSEGQATMTKLNFILDKIEALVKKANEDPTA